MQMSFSNTDLLNQLSRTARWRSVNDLPLPTRWVARQFPQPVWRWLNDEHSLTERLMAISQTGFEVELLQQAVGIPLWHEQAVLNQAPHRAATVREVVLRVDNEPFVLARSIIPMQLMRSYNSGLTELGTQPLGQLLFTNGRARIRRRQFTSIHSAGQRIYARRTPYAYKGSVILVCEFYLPALLDHHRL